MENISAVARQAGDTISNAFIQSFNNARQASYSSLNEMSDATGKTVNQIRSEAMKIAAAYRKQGLNQSDAIKKAYSEMGLKAQTTESKIRSESDKTTKRIKNNGKEVATRVSGDFSNVGEKISSAFSKIGKAVAAAFSVKAVTSFTKKLVETTAQVKAANSQFEQTFGDLSDNASAAMKRVADESGIVQTRLQGVGTSIYAFAKTTGMDSVSALNMMEEALKVTADSAAYYDRSLEDTSESLKSFLKGNYANDAALGLSCTETTRNAAANQLYGKSFRDLSEAQKQLTLLQMVKDANAASGALGQAARESNGLENVLGNLKESWNQLLATIGKPVLNTAVAVIQRITAWIQRLTNVAKAAVSVLSDLFGWQTEDDSAASVQATSDAIGGAADNQADLTKEVKKTNDEVKRGLASFDRLNVISQSKGGSDDDSDSSGIDNPLASGIDNTLSADVALNTDDASTKLEELKKKFSRLLQPVVDFYNKHIKPIYNRIKSAVKRMGQKIGEWFGKLNWEPLKKAVTLVVDKVGKMVDAMLPHIEYLLENVILPIGTLLIETILPTIVDLIGHIIGFLTPVLDGLGRVLRPIWENILQPALTKIAEWFQKIGDKIGPKLELLGEKLGKLFEKLEPIVTELTEELKPAIEAVMDVIGGAISSVLDVLIDSIGCIIDALGGLIDFITGVFTGDWTKAWNGLTDFFLGIANFLIDILNSIWTAIYTTFVSIANFIGGAVKSWGKQLGHDDWGWEFDTETPLIQHLEISKESESSSGGTHASGGRDIPHFATGRIVKAPTLAIVGDNPGAGSGDPEVVAPLSKLQGMMQGGSEYDTRLLTSILDYLKKLYELFLIFRSEGGGSYQFIAQLDGTTLFEEFVKQVNLYKRRHHGALPWS